CFPSRTSLLNRSVSDGYGPMVSVGVTAQAVLLLVVGVVVLVVDDGLAGESPQPSATAAPAAPIAAIASRRPILLVFIRAPRPFRVFMPFLYSTRQMWGKCGGDVDFSCERGGVRASGGGYDAPAAGRPRRPQPGTSASTLQRWRSRTATTSCRR